MIFYHIEIAQTTQINTFVPRVPKRKMSKEDNTTKRICVSTSLEGCLSAAPWGGLCLETYPIGCLYRVYVFEENNMNNIVAPNVLVHEFGVLDAIANNEYWLMEETTPIDTFLISIENYSYDDSEMINGELHTIITNLQYNIVNEKDCGNVIDISKYINNNNFYEKLSIIMESFFMNNCEFIDDFMEDIHFKKGVLYIDMEELFYKKLLITALEDEEYMSKIISIIA